MDTEITRADGGAPVLAEVLDGLNDLLRLDHDAVSAYDVAIEKLQDRTVAEQILGFRRDHERHIADLNELIGRFGGVPRNEPHLTGPFRAAMQGLAAVAGDKGVLMAFRTNELQVRSRYDTYAARANHWPHDVKRLIDRNALDEERHYRWVAELLQAMGVGSGEGPELDAATRAREKSLTGGARLDALRDRAAEVAGTVRERVTPLADAVSNRIAGLLDDEEGPVGAGAVRVREGLEAGKRGADDARVSFERTIRRTPGRMLLAAGVAGFVLGRLLRR